MCSPSPQSGRISLSSARDSPSRQEQINTRLSTYAWRGGPSWRLLPLLFRKCMPGATSREGGRGFGDGCSGLLLVKQKLARMVYNDD